MFHPLYHHVLSATSPHSICRITTLHQLHHHVPTAISPCSICFIAALHQLYCHMPSAIPTIQPSPSVTFRIKENTSTPCTTLGPLDMPCHSGYQMIHSWVCHAWSAATRHTHNLCSRCSGSAASHKPTPYTFTPIIGISAHPTPRASAMVPEWPVALRASRHTRQTTACRHRDSWNKYSVSVDLLDIDL